MKSLVIEHKTVCKRCGKCCYWIINGRRHKCRFLIVHKAKNERITTSCRVYKDRFRAIIGEGMACVERKDSPFDYEGCPYNTKKPIAF